MPWMKFLTASYDDSLSAEHAVNTRRLLKSPWYQSMWGNVFQFTGDDAIAIFVVPIVAGYNFLGRAVEQPQRISPASSHLPWARGLGVWSALDGRIAPYGQLSSQSRHWIS